jgi:hypothetical protein
MSKYVGTWVYDTTASKADLVKLMRVEILPDDVNGFGTVVGLGWAPLLRVVKVGDPTLFLTVTGAWEANATNPESAALFQIGAWPTLIPTVSTTVPRVGIDYETPVVCVSPSGTERAVIGSDGQAETFGFRVERTP